MAAVSSELRSVDPYLRSAFTSGVKFDIGHRNGHTKGSNSREQGREVKTLADQFLLPGSRVHSREWEIEVRTQVSSRKWLQTHGLHKQRLQMGQILESIGFKLCDDYDPSLKRPVTSRYGQGLFEQIVADDGKTFNITCDRDKLLQIRRRLMQTLSLYQHRLDWLTSESRRVFGVVEEKVVTVVMDIRNMSPEQFDQYRAALERVMREQFQNLTKFNLIRVAEDLQMYSEECITCSHGTVESAIQWMWGLDQLVPVSITACAEALLKAFLDRQNEAVYLFTEGTSIDCGRELVLEKVRGVEHKIPVHVVSYNCGSSDTIRFLRNLATVTGGRFHAYAVTMETEDFEPGPAAPDPFVRKANVLLKRKMLGGVADGTGVRPDVVTLFEEMEEARNNLHKLEALIDHMPESNKALAGADKTLADKSAAETEKDEQYMSSRQWLEVHGIDARKLNLKDVLSSVAFRHQDGVVDILQKPSDADHTDAVAHEKLINARYCDKFPVLRWKDDRIVHVQVTPEVHRNYEQRMHVVLRALQQRVDWLKQGSRALFGTVVEEDVYILIDTSASMQHSIQFVKERLLVLMQEQLRHKSRFNLLAFNSKVIAWRDRLMDVNEGALQSAWKWVQDLTCWGSTNTYSAIQAALADTRTQAIYLLTDGRPDQTAKSILTQVQMQKRVPIHTISFNCDDNDANQFLYDLAQCTQGRYHCYTQQGLPAAQPNPWQSEDISLLENEIDRGLDYLDQIAELRDQCATLAWKTEIDALKTSSMEGHSTPDTPGHVISPVPPPDTRELFRPISASHTPHFNPSPPIRPSSAVTFRPSRLQGSPRRPQSAKSHRGRKLAGGYTGRSLLRTLSASGRFTPTEWLLPETASLFEQQSVRQRRLVELLASLGLAPSVKSPQIDVTEKKTVHQKARRKKMAKTHSSSSKQWLKRHGLLAKRLTILDALGPTLVPHRSSYIPVLDKRIMAKVFDEILPIAHVSSRRKNKVTLVNPNGVNLQEYEKKLEKAITQYRRRLNAIVWNALPESVKEEFNSKEPVSFPNNRTKFIQALEQDDWSTITMADIAALEKEILKGEKFLQQSKDLRRAAMEREGEEEEDASNVLLSAGVKESAKEEEKEEEQEEEEEKEEEEEEIEEEEGSENPDQKLQVHDGEVITSINVSMADNAHPTNPPTSSRGSQLALSTSTPRSLKDGTPHSQTITRTPRTPRPPDNPSPRYTGSHSYLRKSVTPKQDGRGKYDGSKRGNISVRSQGVKTKMKVVVNGHVMVSMLKGTKVIARNHADGLYYPGRVVKCPNVRHAIVEFTDGQHDVLTRFIIPVGGAVACPPLSAGDYALVQVLNMSRGTECYVPSIVQFAPCRYEANSPKFFTVMLYNGQKVTTRRCHLVKISKERFELSARYIIDVQGEDRKAIAVRVYVSQNKKTGKDNSRRDRDSSSSSRSRSRSDSRSRSWTPPSRPRSPTPAVGMRVDSSRGPSVTPSREKIKIVGKHDVKATPRSPSSSQSRSRSQSGSRSRRQSNSRSRSSSRSRSGSQARSLSRSRSGSQSRSSSSSQGRNRNRDRSRNRKEQKKKRTRSRSRSPSPEKLATQICMEMEDNGGSESSRSRSHRSRSPGSSSSRSSLSRSGSPPTDRQGELTRMKKQLRRQWHRQTQERRKLERKVKRLSREQRRLKKKLPKEEEAESAPQEAEEEQPIVTPHMLRLRRSLPELSTAEEVLARFSDDGWYYRGMVRQNMGDNSYIVEDSSGNVERIWREDIISDYDDSAPPLKENDRVIAQHPLHSPDNYAPGSILSFEDTTQMATVQFYDGHEGLVPRVDVYRLHREKYNADVLYIQERQRAMVGLSVVARDDNSGCYFPGQIVDVKEGGHNYSVRWSDGSKSEQLPVHIFSAVTRRPRLVIGDRILAMADPVQVVFLPGQIVGYQDNRLVVRFCDGQIRSDVSPLFSYWLNVGYFEEASYFWKIHQPNFGKRQISHV